LTPDTADEVELGSDLRFDPMFEAHYGDIYRYCLRRLGKSDAEDATADVFAVAWRRIKEMPEGELARAWLYGVAYRVVGNQYRGRRRRSRLFARLAASRTEGSPVDDPEGEYGDLLAALGQLSQTDQELLRLTSWDSLTRAEIAHVLGIKENAVDQRLHRARARLKARYDQLDTTSTSAKPREASR
jgi:RNA polymerase sigma-70 factor (ECF subfamily)